MGKVIKIISLIQLIVIFVVFNDKSVYANCPDEIIDLKKAQPIMESHFKDLKTKNRVFDKIDNDSIYLKKEFNYLSKTEKLKILSDLKLGAGQFFSLSNESLNGSVSPYYVYDYLGRIISLPYDGCGNYITLTEHARYNLDAIARGEYKRTEKYKINKTVENNIRKSFHKLFGYNSAIYWIPESKQFEMDLSEINKSKINLFIKKFSKYNFFVMSIDGDFILEK